MTKALNSAEAKKEESQSKQLNRGGKGGSLTVKRKDDAVTKERRKRLNCYYTVAKSSYGMSLPSFF